MLALLFYNRREILGMALLITVINLLFQFYSLMLFVRIMVSWLPELYQYRIVKFICFYTDPYLNLFRSIIPPIGMIDISPIFAFLTLAVARVVIISLLM